MWRTNCIGQGTGRWEEEVLRNWLLTLPTFSFLSVVAHVCLYQRIKRYSPECAVREYGGRETGVGVPLV